MAVLRRLLAALMAVLAAEISAAVPGEKEILLRFKSTVVEDPGGRLATWTVDPGSDPCRDFAGVRCGAAGEVEKIVLHAADLAGTLNPALAGLRSLAILSLFGNRFSGRIPPEYGEIVALRKLNLSRNALSGEIPGFLGDLPSLRLLDLSRNFFSGEIPASLFLSCRRIRFVSFAGNNLSGPVPASIGACLKLKGVDFSFNSLSGGFPEQICVPREMGFISLRSNSLSGGVSGKAASCRSLQFLDLGSNSFDGLLPLELLQLRNLTYLDLSFNQFGGEFPGIGSCGDNLAFLDASGNRVWGKIDPAIASCSGLRFLGLEGNLLTGAIPEALFNLTIVQHLNLSVDGNPGLCGPPLKKPCSQTRNLTSSAIIAITATATVLAGVCAVTIVNFRARRSTTRPVEEMLISESSQLPPSILSVVIGKLVLFSKSLASKHDWGAGVKAFLDKGSLIGVGTMGSVFKAGLQAGVVIAVKKLETLGRINSQEEFEQELGRLGNLHHPNLITLHGFYWSPTMQLVLSEFAAMGSLQDHLHNRESPNLSWGRRYEILVGVARGLAYLHHDCKPQVLHLNLKSANILLDEEGVPKVADYGLGKLLPMVGNSGSTEFHQLAGYVAPELASQSMGFNDKCDVYSFGVVCLELVTGRQPVEAVEAAEVVALSEYVKGMVEMGRELECLDRDVDGSVEDEMVQVLKLGLICTSETASRRPSMAEVVQFLESIRPAMLE
ncbi:probably inactive leucine-rich repeat receptor-like protein kinase At3g28040 [Wolffia australiana]